jgi:hypothetical protein
LQLLIGLRVRVRGIVLDLGRILGT